MITAVARVAFLTLLVLHSGVPAGGKAAEARGRTDAGPTGDKVRITILINEGLLIQSGNTSVLVDAFVDPQEAGGDAKSVAVHDDMLAGRPPFSAVQLALVSHPHEEHFHPVTAGAFLKKQPQAILATSPEIGQLIRDNYGDHPAIEKQLREVRTEKGRIATLTVSGIEVDFVPFNHEARVFYPEQVLGHILHLGGRKIMYIGDAEMQAENWQPYDLKSRHIDMALVPFWLFKEEIARTIIEKHVAPEQVVVVQIPSEGMRERLAELSKQFPDVVFLSTAMASAEF